MSCIPCNDKVLEICKKGERGAERGKEKGERGAERVAQREIMAERDNGREIER